MMKGNERRKHLTALLALLLCCALLSVNCAALAEEILPSEPVLAETPLPEQEEMEEEAPATQSPIEEIENTQPPAAEDTASPSPEATPEDQASPSPEMPPEDQASPSPEMPPEDEASPSPEATPEDTASPSPEATPEVQASPSPEATPEVQASPSPEMPPEDQASPSPDTSVMPQASDEAAPSPTPSPTPEPTPEVLGCIMAGKSDAYSDYHLNPDALDIPGDGLPIPRLYQYDYRTVVCSVNGESKTTATSGCGAVSASMIIAYAKRNYDQTPYSLFYWAASQGHYFGTGLSYGTIQRMLNKYGVDSRLASISSERIVQNLEEGHPIIIKMGPGSFTNEGHYIVLRGLDEDGWVLINDPNSEWRSSQSYSAGLIAREAKESQMLVVYAGNVQKKESAAPEQTAAPAVFRKVSYEAHVIANNVNLRLQPVSGKAVACVPAGTKLDVAGETQMQSDGYVWCAARVNGQILYIRSDMLMIQGDVSTPAPMPTPVPATPAPQAPRPEPSMAAVMDCTMAPAVDVPRGRPAQVSGDRVNLRLQPVNGEVAAVASRGDSLSLLQETEVLPDGYRWCRVLYRNQVLYIRSDMIRVLP